MVTKSDKTPLLSSILELAKVEDILEEKPQNYKAFWLFPIRDLPAIIKRKTDNRLILLKDYLRPQKTWCVYENKDMKPFFVYFLEMASKLYHQKIKS